MENQSPRLGYRGRYAFKCAMKFELEDSMRGASDDELLSEMRRCASVLGRETVTIAEFEQHGRCHPCTLQRRFGSWTTALKLAGLTQSRSKIGITNEELFENIKTMWLRLGRQPRYSEVRTPSSRFSAGTYENRFGSWTDALSAFVEWVNADSTDVSDSGTQEDQPSPSQSEPQLVKRRTRRDISERQRFRILVRDGFRCMACGASPITQPGVQLHVDHIVPWSKGGETLDENLETKCARCNLGKGNAFNA